jgi:hypothetical protein
LSFLNPLILFGLFAAALPILIHLFTRTRSKTIPFSTLDFLKELQNQQIRRIKLRQILLLILRTLIIILIILAFARPTMRGSLSDVAAPNAKTSIVLIVDNSISMTRQNGSSLFTRAKNKAEEIIDLARSGDETFLLTTTDTTNDIYRRAFHDKDVLKRALADIKLSSQLTDISASLTLASRILQSSQNVNKEIYLISDIQSSAFSSDSLNSMPENARLYVLPLAVEATQNLSLQNVRLATSIIEHGKVAEIIASISNTGNRDIDNSLAQLFVNGKRVAQTSFQIDAGASTAQTFRFTVDGRGYSTARLVLEDDDILADNERHLTFYVPEQINIGISGSNPEDTFYAKLVLDPQSIGPDYFALQNLPSANLRYTSFDDLDVVLLSNISSFDQQTTEKLVSFIENGGGLILVLGENIDIRAYNSTLCPALHLPQFIDLIGSQDGQKPNFTLGDYDLDHPIFFGVFEQNDAELTKPRFHFAVKVQADADIDRILHYSNGDPLLFEKKLGQGTILVVTTGFNMQLSDITHRTIFAPLLIRMAGYAGTIGLSASTDVLIGEEIRYKIQPQDVNKTLEMRQPGDKYDRLKPSMTPNGAWIHYSETFTPGIYELLADGQALNMWAVQLDARESELAPIDKKYLHEFYGAELLDPNTVVADYVTSQRHGTELWKFFAIAALILLLVEMMLYREKGEVPAETR